MHLHVNGAELTVRRTVVFPLGLDGGNPAPVVFGGDSLSGEEMRAVAQQFGGETVFVLCPTHPACAVRLRYFVPGQEMQMCVHATVAAVTVLLEEGQLATEGADGSMQVQSPLGPICTSWRKTEIGRDVAVEQFAPEFGPIIEPTSRIASSVLSALGMGWEGLDLAAGPLQVASVSRAKLLIPVRDTAVLDGLQPNFEALWALCDELGATGFYPFTRQPRAPERADIEARQFPLRAGFDEDPATGVAAAALAACLAQRDQASLSLRDEHWSGIRLEQGHAMGRPCALGAEAYVTNGRVTRTRTLGRAVSQA